MCLMKLLIEGLLWVLIMCISLLIEPPNIGNWFSSYVYESPELDSLICFQDFDGAGDTCGKEEITGKIGDNHPAVSAKQVKPCDDGIESNGFDDSGCCESGAVVSESFVFLQR